MMRCGALILAAGASTRLGSPKQLVRINGETLLEHSVRVAREAECAPIVVVLGAFEEEIRATCNLAQAVVISHPNWGEGMGTSLAHGIATLHDLDGAIVMTCDMPAVGAPHFRALAASGALTASCYAGRRGVPAFFPSSLFAALRSLSGDAGARMLLRDAPCIELARGELDVDTAEDLARVRQALEPSR